MFACFAEIPPRNRATEAFMNEDVLQLIFEHFDLQPGSCTAAQTRKDLLSAAKTCKVFVEPALNLLWHILPSFLPLLLLLPSAEITNNYFASPKPSSYVPVAYLLIDLIKFADNLPINNWERFEIHARRVRTLYMESSRVIVPATTYLCICGLRDSCMLPGLTEIYIPDNTSLDLSPIMFLVFGAPLNVVELNNSAISDRSFLMPFLTLLALKSPQLRHLSLCGTGSMSLEPVFRFPSLQHLEIRLSDTYLYPKTLRRLGNLFNLLDLMLDTGRSTSLNTSPPIFLSSSYNNFQRLRKLHS